MKCSNTVYEGRTFLCYKFRSMRLKVNLEIIYKMSQVVEQGIMHVVGGRIMTDRKYAGHDLSEHCIHQK
jgi:lipopolysaccharide/colanic/teichoic acid biosynthesis glycosyltransferase